jgi:transposase-like protein
MKTQIEFPETLQQAIEFFANADTAFAFMVRLRWPDRVVCCPRCQSDKVSFLATRKLWECKGCKVKKQFSVRVGTIFEDSPISLGKWWCAIWLISNAKNGISSCELHRALGVTQKTAWFMLQRIRLALQNGSIVKIGGHVEADETFIGGKARNMHAGKRRAKGTGPVAMTPVMGLLERNTAKRSSRVVLKVVDNTRKPELQGQVRKYVLKGAEVHTDALKSYDGLSDEYTHNVIDHADCYVKGHVHTNGLENFWSLLKRTIKGTYVSVEPFHLFRYLDEQAFRFNERKDPDGDKGRFLTAAAGVIGKGLRYVALIGQDGETPAATWQTA